MLGLGVGQLSGQFYLVKPPRWHEESFGLDDIGPFHIKPFVMSRNESAMPKIDSPHPLPAHHSRSWPKPPLYYGIYILGLFSGYSVLHTEMSFFKVVVKETGNNICDVWNG